MGIAAVGIAAAVHLRMPGRELFFDGRMARGQLVRRELRMARRQLVGGLRALKDLEYEHQVGKIDDEDYARLDRAYRARAKDVLAELDRDLKPYLSRAESLAGAPAERPEKAEKSDRKAKKKAKAKAAKAEPVVAPAVPEPEAPASDEPEEEEKAAAGDEAAPASAAPSTQVCPKCATTNDGDARFCKECATPLGASEEASS